jgi:hypothetical protein
MILECLCFLYVSRSQLAKSPFQFQSRALEYSEPALVYDRFLVTKEAFLLLVNPCRLGSMVRNSSGLSLVQAGLREGDGLGRLYLAFGRAAP